MEIKNASIPDRDIETDDPRYHSICKDYSSPLIGSNKPLALTRRPSGTVYSRCCPHSVCQLGSDSHLGVCNINSQQMLTLCDYPTAGPSSTQLLAYDSKIYCESIIVNMYLRFHLSVSDCSRTTLGFVRAILIVCMLASCSKAIGKL